MDDALDNGGPVVEIKSWQEAPPILGSGLRGSIAIRINEESRDVVMQLLGISLHEFHERYK